VVHGGFHLEKD